MLIEQIYTLRDLLADAGSIASLIGLILTVIIYLDLRRIKNSYIFRIKSPQFVRFLTSKTSALIDLAQDFPNNNKQINIELAKIDVRLNSMQVRTTGSAKKAVIELRERIKIFEQSPNEENFDRVFMLMIRVIDEIKELQQDLNLE